MRAHKQIMQLHGSVDRHPALKVHVPTAIVFFRFASSFHNIRPPFKACYMAPGNTLLSKTKTQTVLTIDCLRLKAVGEKPTVKAPSKTSFTELGHVPYKPQPSIADPAITVTSTSFSHLKASNHFELSSEMGFICSAPRSILSGVFIGSILNINHSFES